MLLKYNLSSEITDNVATDIKWLLPKTIALTTIPQIAFSADPTGTCDMRIGSYISFTALGSNTFQSVGSWS